VFFRHRNFWGVFILGGAGLLSNLTYLPESGSIYLGIYLLTALLLIARVRAVRLRREWKESNFQYDNHLGWLSLSDSFFLAIAVLIIAFALVPVGRHWQPVHDTYEYTRSPLERFEDDFNRLFAGLPARRPLPYRIWGDVIAFQGTINPTTTAVLQVNSPLGMYWKARSYGTYTPKGWVSEDTVLKPTDWTPDVAAPQPYQKRFEVTYAVTPHYSSKNLFAGGQVLSTDQDVRIETYDSPQYTLDLTDPTLAAGLPPKLTLASLSMERALRQAGANASNSTLAQSLPPDFELADVSRRGGNVETVTLSEVIPEQPDTLALRNTGREVKAGETYTITSSVSLAKPQDLRTAGLDYPTWALAKYTQLSPSLPQRVRNLGNEITGGAETPYEKAIAIENYLKRSFPYNLTIEPPPYNSDGVDYFLFTNQTGYSEYFASSMTVLLRTQGIPARLATGYTVGDQLPDHEDVFIVADSHSHAWVEVFFPRFGWIPFEPTPGRELPEAFAPVFDEADPAFAFPEEELDSLLCDEDDVDDCDDDDELFQSGTADENQVTITERALQTLPWFLSVLGFIVVVGGLAWLFWRRYLAPSTDPLLTFRHLAFLGGLNSVGPSDYQTPYQYQ
ncbi:MAG: transglutaminase family protein, partial [Dehalococcoidia bacterium]